MNQPRTKKGTFGSKYSDKDIEEIVQLLDEGVEPSEIRFAIQQTKRVSEPTAYNWIRLARTKMEDHGKTT